MTISPKIGALKALAAASVLAVTASIASAEDRAGWPDSFSVGTASQGGTYFVYGAGWANMVAEALGLPGGTEVTGGPVQNAALVQAGELDMGMVTMGPAFDAMNGEERWRYRIDKTHLGRFGSLNGPISTPLIADGRVVCLGDRRVGRRAPARDPQGGA